MAISHAQPLLLILLLSLFFLPAALGNHEFLTCNPILDYPIDVKAVKVFPDPVDRSTSYGNIEIIGDTSVDIPAGVTIELSLEKPLLPLPVSKKSYSLCDITACPVAPGPIKLFFNRVFTRKELQARSYFVRIRITEEQQIKEMMCVSFHCHIYG